MTLLPLGILASSGAGASAVELIQTLTSSGSTATISFNSIPATYKHLMLHIVSRSTYATTGGQLFLNVNAAFTGSETDYNAHNIYSGGSTPISQSLSTGSTWQIGRQTSANDPSNAFGVTYIELLDYADTSKRRTMRYQSGSFGTSPRLETGSGFRDINTAVSSLHIANDALANFAAGSRFSLYGVKG